MRAARDAAVLLASGLAAGCLASGYRTKPKVAVVEGDPVVQMARPADFRSETNPRWAPAREQFDPPGAHELVLGLEIHGVKLAYPIGLLDRAEVVNDGVAGTSWVATRCPLAHVAAIYDRSVDGRALTFENSGALWRDTLVMRDLETGTYWTAATGVALWGPLAGHRLQPLPAVYTSAVAWARGFPESGWADLGIPTSVPLDMKLYGLSPWQGVSGEKTADRRHSAKKEFLAVAVGREALAFTREEIRGRGAAESEVGGERVRVEWDARLDAPRARVIPAEGEPWHAPVAPMYWFALARHFDVVHLLDEPSARTVTGP
jgi:hypothetical protein